MGPRSWSPRRDLERWRGQATQRQYVGLAQLPFCPEDVPLRMQGARVHRQSLARQQANDSSPTLICFLIPEEKGAGLRG